MSFSLKPLAPLVHTMLVRKMLAGHSAVALTVAALLYLISVTGTFSVFYQDYERWEQPSVQKHTEVTSAQISHVASEVYHTEARRSGEKPRHIHLALPTEHLPRFAAHAGNTNGYINLDGNLGAKVKHEWTHFVTQLHYALTLPKLLGLTLVGIVGVLVMSLIVSRLLARPNIFKDAFSLRLEGTKRLRKVNLHNRLAVWTAPFLFVMAFTGAVIGLSQVLIFAIASTFSGGDTSRASQSLFLSHVGPGEEAAPLADVEGTYRNFLARYPNMKPMSLTVHEPGTVGQSIEIKALVPNRFIWSQIFSYDAQGQLLDKAGWSDGDAGVQLYASMYRLHFGHFGGLPIKLLYTLLGIAMCYVNVTGVNFWLARRRQQGMPALRAEGAWCALVWAVPLGLALSAVGYFGTGLKPVPTFWGVLVACLALGLTVNNVHRLSAWLRLSVTITCTLVVGLQFVQHGKAAISPAAALVNSLWLLLALGMGASLFTGRWAPLNRLARWMNHAAPASPE